MKNNQVLLAFGVLSWFRSERVSDRYGSVSVYNEDSMGTHLIDNSKINLDEVEKFTGKKGKLICEVLDTRESTHIGDMFHGFFPKTPQVGQKFTLGEGTLFSEQIDDQKAVGVEPEDGRNAFWLDPKKLYNVHEQTVNLYFEPEEVI